MGRRYWPSVSRSTPIARRSARVSRISASVSPSPSIRLVFTSTPGRCRLACASTASVCSYDGARITDGMREATHGLDVLREHLEAAVDDGLDVRQHALKIGGQRLDCRLRIERLDFAHARCEVCGATVGQIVAVHRREHDVAQLHQLHGARGVRGLLGVEPAARIAGVDRAEAAGARADLAHQHDRRGAGVPALADVRALGFLADRREAMLADCLLDGLEAATGRHRRAQPRRLAACGRHRRAGRGRLDAVADGGEALRRLVFLAAAAPGLGAGCGGGRDDGDALEVAHVGPDRGVGSNCTASCGVAPKRGVNSTASRGKSS